MADTILAMVKTMLELDISEDIFDDQLLLYLNAGIQYLINNKIPVTSIGETTTPDAFTGLKTGDSQIVIQWLHLYCLQRFDRTLMEGSGTTLNWLDGELQDLIYQLKVIYDQPVVPSP